MSKESGQQNMKGHGERFDDDTPERKGKKDKKVKPRRVKRVDSQAFGSEVDEVEVHFGSQLADAEEGVSRGDAVENNPSEPEAKSVETGKGVELPLMITKDMRQQLLDRGMSKKATGGLTPEEAWKILNGEKEMPVERRASKPDNLPKPERETTRRSEERIEELKERARTLARKDVSGKKEKMTREEELEEKELRSQDEIFQVAYNKEMNKLADEKATEKPSENDGLDSEIVVEQKKNLMSAMRGGTPSLDKVKELGLWVERRAKRGFLGNKEEEVRAAYREIVDEVEKFVREKQKTEAQSIGQKQEGVDESPEGEYNVNEHGEDDEMVKQKIELTAQNLADAAKKLEELRVLYAENIDLKKLVIARNKLRG